MGHVRPHQPVKLIASLLTADSNLLSETESALEARLGRIDYRSRLLPFDCTSYYEPEFGLNLVRRFVTFETLIDAPALSSVKLATNDLEARWMAGGRRRVNIDPGYIALGKLVLATTKDQAHRIDIGQGIFAEVTLRYQGGSFKSWEWTYPDYASQAYIDLLNELRMAYYRQLREQSGTGGGAARPTDS